MATTLTPVVDPWFSTLRLLIMSWLVNAALLALAHASHHRAETDGPTDMNNCDGFFRLVVTRANQRDDHPCISR